MAANCHLLMQRNPARYERWFEAKRLSTRGFFKFSSGGFNKTTKMKIVLAYSGGLDTSVLLSWIKETYNAEMIAFCADIGQEDELRGLEKKALKTGASKIYIDDLREEFARDFIYPIIQA